LQSNTPGNPKPKPAKGETPHSSHKQTPVDPYSIHDACRTDPDLAAVVAAWPDLPEALKTGIVVMVKTASGNS
jgi:hypothetical protein